MGRLITEKHLKELGSLFPGAVRTNVLLAEISSWRIGGIADCIIEPCNVNQIRDVVNFAKNNGIPYFVFGATTNLLFPDDGLKALAIKIGPKLSRVRINDNRVVAEAGIWTPLLARKIAKAGLVGAEHIVGIPGNLGGLACMNGGSNRRSIGENITAVSFVSPSAEIVRLNQADCMFSYRNSIFKEDKDNIIFEVELLFNARGEPKVIQRKMLMSLRDRRNKFPRKTPSCGSVFLSNPELYKEVGSPGAVIEKCGLKGMRIGGAMVSNKHANFIVNIGNATCQDVISLVGKIKHEVCEKTGALLQSEIRFVDSLGRAIDLER